MTRSLTPNMPIRRTMAVLLLTAGIAPAGPAAAQEREELAQFSAFIDLMESYYGLLDAVHQVAESPQRTAILHMQKLREIHEDRGDMAAAADGLRAVLERSEDPVVRNAARMMLVDVLRDTGRATEALRVIDEGLAENAGGR
ncbi:MAG: hypothetical protein V2J24_11320 [Pseudomonadales bacterium]|jgi:hypothetical protein|nr:hypothetical protein [Pseudomonadales bacterium]